jgi:toxin ParE1/3/4
VGKYRLTPRAETDRDHIARYTLERWGETQCATYLDELETCFERLADVPGMGIACNDIRPGYRRFPFGEHDLYYRIEDEGVLIVRIYPQRMLPRKKMLDEGRA